MKIIDYYELCAPYEFSRAMGKLAVMSVPELDLRVRMEEAREHALKGFHADLDDISEEMGRRQSQE